MKGLSAAFLVAAVVAGSAAATTSPPKLGNASAGRKLFIQHDCGSCHMLAAANAMSPSGIGPDLDTTKKSYALIVANITKGGKGMTGYGKTLTTVQIDNIATFVYKSARAASSGGY
jgi:mono/diheme cytochrome c family protein